MILNSLNYLLQSTLLNLNNQKFALTNSECNIIYYVNNIRTNVNELVY